MYFPYFISYMIVGFAISLIVFFWALNNGQFKDQQRARFLPLEEGPDLRVVTVTKINRYEAYGLLFLACAGLMASAALLIFAILSAN